MYYCSQYSLAVVLCVVTMFCWGSWGNTQKLAGKTWRYELFYWDYVIGMVLFSLLLAFTAGSIGSEGRPFLQDLGQADLASIANVIVVDIEQLAKDNGVPRSANVILLGAAQKALGIDYEKIEEAIRSVFGRKGEKIVEANIKALAIGKEAQR